MAETQEDQLSQDSESEESKRDELLNAKLTFDAKKILTKKFETDVF